MTQAARFWIGTSWKMNKTLTEALTFAEGLKAADRERDPRIQRFVVPSFTAVREVKALLSDSSVKVGGPKYALVGSRRLDWRSLAPDANRL